MEKELTFVSMNIFRIRFALFARKNREGLKKENIDKGYKLLQFILLLT